MFWDYVFALSAMLVVFIYSMIKMRRSLHMLQQNLYNENNEEITVTDPNMTRYFMSLNEAMDLVEQAFYQGNNGDIFIKNAKLCKISDLAEAVKFVLKKQNHPVKIIGTRTGEKRHEDLLTKEELNYAYILKDCLIIPMDKKHRTKLVLLKQKCLMKDIVSLIKEDYYE